MMDDFYDGVIDKLIALLEQDPDARPISDDLPALVRTLSAVTSFTLTHDSAFVGRGEDPARAIDIVVQLWLSAFWVTSSRDGIVCGMAQSGFTGKRCFLTGARKRNRPRDRTESWPPTRRAVPHRPRCRGP